MPGLMMSLFLALLHFSVFCSSCTASPGVSGGALEPNAHTDDSGIPLPLDEADTHAFLKPLQEACLATTGRHLDPGGVCRCPEAGFIFYFAGRLGQGRCARPVVGGASSEVAHFEPDANDGASVDPDLEISPGTVLNVYAPFEPDDGQGAWTRRLAALFGRGAPLLWKPLQAYNELNVYVGRPQAMPDMHELIAGTLLSQARKNSLDTFRTHMVEPDWRYLDAALGMVPLTPPQRGLLFQRGTQAGLDASTVDALVTAYDDIVVANKDVKFERAVALSRTDCTGDCILYSVPLHVDVDAQVVVERIYSSGSLARESMWYRRNGELRAVVILGPNRIPGLILALAPQLGPHAAGGVVRVYDRTWHELGAYRVPLPDDFDRLLELQRRNAFADAGLALMMCESDMRGVMADPTLAYSLAFGPHLPVFLGDTLQRGSVFGWIENTTGAMDDYLHGFAKRTFGFIPRPGWRDENSSAHGREVVRVALEVNPGLRIRPIGGLLACFANYARWHAAVAGRASVVNGSFSESMQPQTCEPQVLPTLQQSAETTLWVMAAGNEDGMSRLDTPTIRCPGMLAGEKNLLIVAGSEGDHLDRRSIFGRTYADIAAPWAAGRGSQEGGTSFAAPRVAAVAAELADMYPNLSPSALRLTLMASSRVAPALRDSVRSGGLLNRDAAVVLGECVDAVSEPGVPLSPGMLHLCMSDAHFSEKFIQDKMSLLYERGVFQE